MKILFVIAGLTAGGAERQMTYLARGMKERGHEIALCVFTPKRKVHFKDILELSIPIYFADVESGEYLKGPLKIISCLKNAVEQFNPDVLFSMLHVANTFVRIAKFMKFIKTPVITAIRTDYRKLYLWDQKISEFFLKSISDMIITNHLPTKKYFEKEKYDKIKFIPNGIPYIKDEECKKHIKRECLNILCVGRIVFYQKNQDSLLSGVAELIKKNDNMTLTFVGNGCDLERLKRKSLDSGIDDKVTFIKSCDNLTELYREYDLLILPSLMEGCPNVLLEAMMIKLPVVVSAYIGGLDIVEDRYSGIIASGNKDDDFADAIQIFHNMEEKDVVEMAENARKFICTEYSLKKMMFNYEKIFNDVAGLKLENSK